MTSMHSLLRLTVIGAFLGPLALQGFIGRVLGELPAGYNSMSALEKQQALWEQIEDTSYDSQNMPLPTEDFTMANISKLFDPNYDSVSYLLKSDELPRTRLKLAHPYGSVCMVHFNITNNDTSFTGLFRSGGIGLLRMSSGNMDQTAIAVGLGLKIFISGQNSQNFLLLFTRAGQGSDRNFFANPMSNVIPAEPATPVDGAFEKAILALPGKREENPENGLNIPLFEQASVTSDGTKEEKVVTPYRMTLTPNADLGWASDDTKDFRTHLADIPMGSVLYTVSARRRRGDEDIEIGQLITSGQFVASVYGDKTLFFSHPRTPWKL
ncbi:hypothetical protein BV898_08931 [Hypsibius exemplaris]|uniref:Uncharacterized protein n=1 Tax=Hypsibius exemplaris TaxID=2072580 RepID=A0A1W0WNY8_HYPEX|nr:hypothetical protein BV898_08931 [Hypsibius exemplaris]